MGKIKFTREEMAIMIDMLNSIVTDEEYLSAHLARNCPFWNNVEVREDCSNKSCLSCVSDNMVAFLNIINDVFIKGKSPIDTLTEESSAKAQITKVRIYSSDEDYSYNTLAWFALTDEQLRLFNYLVNNGYLTDGINYEICNDADFTTV